mmetsp:Transcript_14913/g.56588  ORF Transcript_14913/g.56588 Transcript_14913/m.56588 type:complete len:373 (-) Transcript_14913:3034-4152(-)
MMTIRAASMPSVPSTSQMLLLSVFVPSTPGVPMTVPNPRPSTRSVYFFPGRPCLVTSSSLMTARPMVEMPCTMTPVSAALRSCMTKYTARWVGMPSLCSFFEVAFPGHPSGGRTRSRSLRSWRIWTCPSLSARSTCGLFVRMPKGSWRMQFFTVLLSMFRCSWEMRFMSRWMLMYILSGMRNSCMRRQISPRVVFSNLAFTTRALISFPSCTSCAVMMGVLILAVALMISFSRGTPRVTFMLATPAKWNVFSVICVPGSLMDWAPMAPTASPGSTMPRVYLCSATARMSWTSSRVTPAQLRTTRRASLDSRPLHHSLSSLSGCTPTILQSFSILCATSSKCAVISVQKSCPLLASIRLKMSDRKRSATSDRI